MTNTKKTVGIISPHSFNGTLAELLEDVQDLVEKYGAETSITFDADVAESDWNRTVFKVPGFRLEHYRQKTAEELAGIMAEARLQLTLQIKDAKQHLEAVQAEYNNLVNKQLYGE